MVEKRSIGFFEKFLTLWVILCMGAGILIGQFLPEVPDFLSRFEYAQVSIPVAILIWLMIYPMMLQVDFASIADVGKNPRGLALTLIINWLIKPCTMAFFAWVFFDKLYIAYLTPELAQEYIAGAIILGAAPCTAMVFVWSYLTKGDPEYTLVQVAINDLVLLVAFIPIVSFLLGITDISIPYETLISSVLIFVVVPLVAGYIANKVLVKTKGEHWFKHVFILKLKPISIFALLTTLVLLFAFQGELAGVFYPLFRAELKQIGALDYLGADETPLHVGMDDAGGHRRG